MKLSLLPQGLGTEVATAQSKAISWLERNLKLLDVHGDAYEVAIVAYALMVSRSSSAETAFSLLARRAINDGNATNLIRNYILLE